MGVFDHTSFDGHQQVVFCRRIEAGLTAIIAIHDTTLGPAIGGCRMAVFDRETDALDDAFRRSRAMTYKAAGAGINLGGAAAVIFGDPATDKNEALLRAFGQFVESLDGRFIASSDMGTTSEDMDLVNVETDHVAGVGQHYGGSGDPSPICGWGVLYSMKVAVARAMGADSLAGKKVAIQGFGNVGYQIGRYLHDEGAELVVADLESAATDRAKREFGATVVPPDRIHAQEVDVFAPCAVGGVLNPSTIREINAQVVCGSANNQLEDEKRDARMLDERGILYAPDYVVNAGGLISVYSEIHAAPRQKAMQDAETIAGHLQKIIARTEEEGINMLEAANKISEERMASIARLASFHLGPLE